MRRDEPPKQINDEHPAFTQIIQLGVANISIGLMANDCFVYRLDTFKEVTRPVLRSTNLDMPFYTFFAAFRSSLMHFCAEPVFARDSMEHIVEWAEERGIQGLLGLHSTNNKSTQVYLTHPTAVVLCRIEFA